MSSEKGNGTKRPRSEVHQVDDDDEIILIGDSRDVGKPSQKAHNKGSKTPPKAPDKEEDIRDHLDFLKHVRIDIQKLQYVIIPSFASE
jgi:hypothetical protein